MNSQQLLIEMPDGSKWLVPVIIIINYRMVKVSEIEKKSLKETARETVSLFSKHPEAIVYWANEMDWADVAPYARQIESPRHLYESAWAGASKEIVLFQDKGIMRIYPHNQMLGELC